MQETDIWAFIIRWGPWGTLKKLKYVYSEGPLWIAPAILASILYPTHRIVTGSRGAGSPWISEIVVENRVVSHTKTMPPARTKGHQTSGMPTSIQIPQYLFRLGHWSIPYNEIMDISKRYQKVLQYCQSYLTLNPKPLPKPTDPTYLSHSLTVLCFLP